MQIRISTGLPWSRHGQATDSVANPCLFGTILVLPGQSGGRLWLFRGHYGAKPWLKRGLSGFKMSRTTPDETRTTPGRHTDYPDELWMTHGLHPDDAGLALDCNTPRTAPCRPGCFKHFKTSGADPGPSRTTKDQPRITPDQQGPAKDEPRICHGWTRTTPDHAGFLVRVGLTGALHIHNTIHIFFPGTVWIY